MYEINCDTLAIIYLGDETSEVIEKDNSFIINATPMKIIDYSCRYFGSSYNGRFLGTKEMIGVSHKAPIIIEESKGIIFFPTKSTRLDDCSWVSLNNLKDYKKSNSKSVVIFNSGDVVELDISFGVLDNQVLRASRLESILRLRKEKSKMD